MKFRRGSTPTGATNLIRRGRGRKGVDGRGWRRSEEWITRGISSSYHTRVTGSHVIL